MTLLHPSMFLLVSISFLGSQPPPAAEDKDNAPEIKMDDRRFIRWQKQFVSGFWLLDKGSLRN
jgi:hypothetical protein